MYNAPVHCMYSVNAFLLNTVRTSVQKVGNAGGNELLKHAKEGFEGKGQRANELSSTPQPRCRSSPEVALLGPIHHMEWHTWDI